MITLPEGMVDAVGAVCSRCWPLVASFTGGRQRATGTISQWCHTPAFELLINILLQQEVNKTIPLILMPPGTVRWYEHAGHSVHSDLPGGPGAGGLGCGRPRFWSVGSVSADCTGSGMQPCEATGIYTPVLMFSESQ